MNIKDFSPAPGFALVKPVEIEAKTVSGLITTAKVDNVKRGIVLAVGYSYTTDYGAKIEFPLTQGEVAIFTNGMLLSHDHVDYYIISRNNVLGSFPSAPDIER